MVRAIKFRQSEYIGENRCQPCTVVNCLIAIFTAGCLAVIDPFLAVLIVLVSAVLIYYRGYLIPGTPELTKRFMPAWLMRLFGKELAGSKQNTETENGTSPEVSPNFDAITELTRAGIIVEDDDDQEVRLTADFQALLHQSEFENTHDVEAVFQDVFHSVSLVDRGTSPRLLRNEVLFMSWSSKAAMIGDARTAIVLTERYGFFTEYSEREQLQLLQSIRLLLDVCPMCGEDLKFTQKERETCCHTYMVTVFSCNSCNDVLFEVNEDVA